MDEIWKPIPGYGERYEASNLGRIRVVGKDALGRSRYMGHVLADSFLKGGYRKVLVGGKNRVVHVLVMLAFEGPPPPGHEVNHKDGDKANNRLGNLEYKTKAQNYRHALDVLGYQPPHGAKHWAAKLSAADVEEIKHRCAAGELQKHVAADYGVRPNAVSRIMTGTRRRLG